MSESTAIGMVSKSLQALLQDETLGMHLTPSVDVTLLAPDEKGESRRVNLFLYQIRESPTLRNEPWRPRPGVPGQLAPPPLSLNLFYLMTAFAPNDAKTGNADAHAILGEAMRVFHENPILPADPDLDILEEELRDAREQIKIILHTVDLDELSSVWTTFNSPLRLSVLYEISVVQLDMLPASGRPLPPRVRGIGVPALKQPFSPPRVERIEPISGPAGTVVTAHGAHLDGWSASAVVLRRLILDTEAIAGDSFEIPLPGDLDPGFHALRVNVSNLFRATFFFEVTP